MTCDKKKFQKKKDREKAVRKKILDRREKIRAEAKEKEKWDRQERVNEPKQKPLCKVEARRQQALREAEIKQQLMRNIELLKALEAEYEKENGGRPVEPNTITVCPGEKVAE